MDLITIAQIKEHLDVLNFQSLPTQDEIVRRTEQLNTMLTKERTLDEEGELTPYTLSMQFLLEHYDAIKSKMSTKQEEEMHQEHEFDPIFDNTMEVAYRQLQIRVKRNRLKQLAKKIAIVILILTIIGLAVGIPVGKKVALNHRYDKINEWMLDFQPDNMYLIGETIEKIPRFHLRIETIKGEYQWIMKHVDILESGNVYVDHEEMFQAYHTLYIINESSYSWDLSKYLDSVGILVLLMEVVWSNGEFEFGLRANSAKTGPLLYSTVPNKKEPAKQYYFYMNFEWQEYGYERIQDRRDRHRAYRIVGINPTTLWLYAYATDEIYIMHPIDAPSHE